MQSYSLKDVRECWMTFSDLPLPWCGEGGRGGAPARFYKQREDAWIEYTRARDHYLYSIGKLTLNELNMVWYKSMTTPFSSRFLHKN